MVRTLSHTHRGSVLTVSNAARELYSLRFISLAEHSEFRQRIELLKGIKFTHAANLLEIITEGNRVGVLSEPVTGVPLEVLLRENQEISLSLAKLIYENLKNAVTEFHSHAVAHMNLSPATIIVDPETGRVTLIDFTVESYGAPQYQAPAELDVFEADLWVVQRIAAELNLPEGTDGNQDDEEFTQLTPAQLLRAEYAKDATGTGAVDGKKQVKTKRSKKNKHGGRGFLSVVLLLVGVVSFLYWWSNTADSTTVEAGTGRAGSIERAANFSEGDAIVETGGAKRRTTDSRRVCPTDADALAIVRGLISLRNQALMELDVTKLERVYAGESLALQADKRLLTRLGDSGKVINGLATEIKEVKVRKCEAEVTVWVQHRLLAYEQCSAAGCVKQDAEAMQTEEIILQSPLWRIKEIRLAAD